MDYNKFEDRISRWIENDMDVKERREFEKFLSDHPEYQLKVEEVRNAISMMNQAPNLKVSSDFDSKLNQRIDALSLNKSTKKSIFLVPNFWRTQDNSRWMVKLQKTSKLKAIDKKSSNKIKKRQGL